MLKLRYIATVAACIWCSLLAFSSEGQEMSVCSFSDVLRAGLEKNFSIRLSELQVESMRGRVVNTYGTINPYLDLSLNSNAGKDPTLTYGDYKKFNASFVLPTRHGINYTTGFAMSRIAQLETPSPDLMINTSGAWVGANVSLLRGLGYYNQANAGILAVNRYYAAQKAALSDQVLRYVRDVSIAYLQLQKNVRIYEARSEDQKEAEAYLKYIQEMIAYNEIPAAEINRAQAFLIGYNEKKIDAENEVVNSLNNLYQQLGIANRAAFDQVPACSGLFPEPTLLPARQDAEKILANVDNIIQHTIYYKSLSESSAGAAIEMKSAENMKRHQLDLDMRYYYFGSTFNQGEDKFFETLSSTLPGGSFNVTLSYRLPFQNQYYRGQYISKLADYESRLTQAEKTKFEAATAIKNLLNNIRNLENLYKYARQYAEVQNKTYRDEMKKFRLGSANQLDIISAYETFADARINSYELAYNIYNATFQLKYLIGDLPKDQAELEGIDIMKMSVITVPEY